jgi:hypothetical protein
MMRFLPALLLLAACSSGESGSNSSEDGSGGGGAGAAQVQQDTPANATGDPQNVAIPLEPPPFLNNAAAQETARPALTAVPGAFQGRWGLVPADCEAGRADNKGLMTVAADRLTFYESRARATDVAATPSRVTATLRYSGEGQQWSHGATMTLQDNGRTLVFDEPESDTGVRRYTRCPADAA